MKHYLIILFSATVLLSSCGGNDKNAQLERLKKQQSELSEKIEKLEKELAKEGKIQKGSGTNVKVKTLKYVSFSHNIEIQGNVISDMNIYVPMQSQTLVKAINVKEGDKVRKGQILAESDGSIIEKSVASLKVSLDLANTVYERQERLWKQEIGSEIQYLQAKANKEMLEKQMALLNEQLKLTRIIAPIDGTVDRIDLKVGESGMFGGIRVIQMNALKVEASVSEEYIGSLHTGDPVKVFIPGADTTFITKIGNVSKVIDKDNRTFNIEFSIPSNIKNIRPNMIAVLNITDYTNPKVLTIPMNIAQRKDNSYFVFVASKAKDGYKAEKREIRLGKIQSNTAEVLIGLKEGEQLIHVGYSNLRDGDPINLM